MSRTPFRPCLCKCPIMCHKCTCMSQSPPGHSLQNLKFKIRWVFRVIKSTANSYINADILTLLLTALKDPSLNLYIGRNFFFGGACGLTPSAVTVIRERNPYQRTFSRRYKRCMRASRLPSSSITATVRPKKSVTGWNKVNAAHQKKSHRQYLPATLFPRASLLCFPSIRTLLQIHQLPCPKPRYRLRLAFGPTRHPSNQHPRFSRRRSRVVKEHLQLEK